MHLRTPFWWYRRRGALASALSPLGAIYGRLAENKVAGVTPYRSRLPVICIGNFTAGGGGKTPTAIAVAELLKAAGERPCFLTRGYGGNSEGPLLVAEDQTAAEVGDETLLLKAHAPVVVAADRAAGAKLIEGTDATVIVMDDGFQNPGLAKDLSLIVADAATGIGNGLVMPAGPLRAPLEPQLDRADALLGRGRVKYVHPDCGFWMLKRNMADGKIRALVEGRDLYEGRSARRRPSGRRRKP